MLYPAFSDVLNDIRAVIADDQALMPHVLPALRAYNVKQLQAVEHPAVDGQAAHVVGTVLLGMMMTDEAAVPAVAIHCACWVWGKGAICGRRRERELSV